MKKLMIMSLLVMAICYMGFAQNPTEVPRPAEVPSGYFFNGNFFYDFDGDGSKDVLLVYEKENIITRYFAIYSYLKKQTISVIFINSFVSFQCEDLDKNGAAEIVIITNTNPSKTLIYNVTSSVDTKKKLP